MESVDFSWPVFIAGLARVAIWWIGAVLAFRMRWVLLPAGFAGCGLTAVVFAFNNAHMDVPVWLVDLASVMAAPLAALIVMGFVVNAQRRTGTVR